MKTLIFTFLLVVCFNFSVKSQIFKPHIVESSQNNVCNLALEHYSHLFKSKKYNTEAISQSEKIIIPEFFSKNISGLGGELKTANVDFYGSQKVFAYYGRSHSWRGDIHTGYVVEPEKISLLESHLKEKKKGEFLPFYPMGALAYGSDFSWWENLPFQYEGKWYVLTDFGDFHRHDSQRSIFQILEDGTSKSVCTIKIFQNFDEGSISEILPLFSAYKRSLEKIMLSSGYCGTSHPEVDALWSGRFFASMAVIRPWAVEPTWKNVKNKWELERIEFQQKHFDDWKYQDIWSYREHATYNNLIFDAISELKNHYVTNYSYSDSDALEHASKIVKSMPGRYYSLGIYYDQDKDFSIFQKIVDGTYENWSNLKQDLKLKYTNIPLVALSLMIDNPEQYKMLPAGVKPSLVKSFYEKDILMFAAHMNNFDSVKYLLDSGWPVDKVTNHEPTFCEQKFERLNRSALTYAAENASIEVIRLLVEAGADTNIKDSKGNSLDYYINLNPRFSAKEKEFGFEGVLKLYSALEQAKPKPSFSCNRKLNRIEGAICDSTGLSIYDRELAKGYKAVVGNKNSTVNLKRSQVEWLKRRNIQCSTFSEKMALNACLARTTRARIRYLDYLQSEFE